MVFCLKTQSLYKPQLHAANIKKNSHKFIVTIPVRNSDKRGFY